MEEITMQGTIDTKELNKWLEVNVAHMKESTILTPACWYDGCRWHVLGIRLFGLINKQLGIP